MTDPEAMIRAVGCCFMIAVLSDTSYHLINMLVGAFFPPFASVRDHCAYPGCHISLGFVVMVSPHPTFAYELSRL